VRIVVAINPLADDVFSLAEAAKRLPRLRGDRPVAPSTLWRWATRGLRGNRLEIVRVGGVACMSAEALRQFFAALNGQPERPPAVGGEKRHETVERELAARGY
jgi:hypothetical protein